MSYGTLTPMASSCSSVFSCCCCSSSSQRMAVPSSAAPMRASSSPPCEGAPSGCVVSPHVVSFSSCKSPAAPARVGIAANASLAVSSKKGSFGILQRQLPLLLSTHSTRLRGAGDGAVAVEEQEAGGAVQEDAVPIEKRYSAFPSVLDINAIRDILPHRFPFLLVDRIIEYHPRVTAVGIKNVTINDNFFPGHFPDRPIMPGVLMVEAMAQVGGIVLLSPDVGGSKENFFFAGVDRIRFRKPVIAGDTLVMRMTVLKLRMGIAKLEGKAYVGGELVCDGEFMLALGS